MINRYIWELYLKSGGDKVVEAFRKNIEDAFTPEYASFIRDLKTVYCVSKGEVKDTYEQLEDLSKRVQQNLSDIQDADIFEPEKVDVQKEFEAFLRDTVSSGDSNLQSEKNIFIEFTGGLAYYSSLLAFAYPGIFIPYYFFGNYNVLTIIAETFDIVMPTLPKKADYHGRTWHYLEICESLNEFKEQNGLSFYELCAFLYDFAPKYIGGIDSYILKELPDPKSAFFIGGGGKNGDATAEDDPENITWWQSNPDTRAGDMIVMYLTTPISAVSSIWRSYSIGFVDPFFYYYRCTYIGKPVKTEKVSLQDIKNDEILGKMPIVSKNMQGINGVELKPSEYNRILEVVNTGNANSDIPVLEYVTSDGVTEETEYVNEKEVEEKLIKPLIKKLGYSETDYVKQLSVALGNHNRALIPDFVLNPRCTSGHYAADIIIEAKRSIKNEAQLEDVKIQARSYAKMLGTRYSVIASQEKVWITSSKDDYADTIFEETWSDLLDGDKFYELRKIIGKQ